MTLCSDNQDKEKQEKSRDGGEKGAAQVFTALECAQARRSDGGSCAQAH